MIKRKVVIAQKEEASAVLYWIAVKVRYFLIYQYKLGTIYMWGNFDQEDLHLYILTFGKRTLYDLYWKIVNKLWFAVDKWTLEHTFNIHCYLKPSGILILSYFTHTCTSTQAQFQCTINVFYLDQHRVYWVTWFYD